MNRLFWGYWEQQLVRSPYGHLARRRAAPEFSARIECHGLSHVFPLGSDSKEEAAARALEIYQTALNDGWPIALQNYPREFTLSIFWAENPMIFTYTTLYTVVGADRAREAKRPKATRKPKRRQAVIIEPEESCRRGLAEWMSSLPDCSCHGLFATGAEALAALEKRPVQLALFNRLLPDMPAGEFARSLKRLQPSAGIFSYRIYTHSDELFVSQPAKSGGYYFRRRPPHQLLDPIRSTFMKAPAPDWQASVASYVSNLFRAPLEREEAQGPFRLTGREQEILTYLCRGSTDKDIASVLNISSWTVHTHLKKIFEKLGVHSRTQAVIKYLQK